MTAGDKVRCINGSFPKGIGSLYRELPVAGHTYLVREARIDVDLFGEGDVSLLLEGVQNPKANSKAALERGFSVNRFETIECP